MIAIESHSRGVLVPVRVKAGARRIGVVGEHDGALRIDVTAPPEKGKANRAVAEVLAGALGVSKSSVQIISGATSSQKRFLVVDIDAATAATRLAAAVRGLR